MKLPMKTIKASEFKAKCLKLMDEVAKNDEAIIITKNGKPVSKLVPYHSKPETLFGLHHGVIKSHDTLIAPVAESWDAEC